MNQLYKSLAKQLSKGYTLADVFKEIIDKIKNGETLDEDDIFDLDQIYLSFLTSGEMFATANKILNEIKEDAYYLNSVPLIEKILYGDLK